MARLIVTDETLWMITRKCEGAAVDIAHDLIGTRAELREARAEADKYKAALEEIRDVESFHQQKAIAKEALKDE